MQIKNLKLSIKKLLQAINY